MSTGCRKSSSNVPPKSKASPSHKKAQIFSFFKLYWTGLSTDLSRPGALTTLVGTCIGSGIPSEGAYVWGRGGGSRREGSRNSEKEVERQRQQAELWWCWCSVTSEGKTPKSIILTIFLIHIPYYSHSTILSHFLSDIPHIIPRFFLLHVAPPYYTYCHICCLLYSHVASLSTTHKSRLIKLFSFFSELCCSLLWLCE